MTNTEIKKAIIKASSYAERHELSLIAYRYMYQN